MSMTNDRWFCIVRLCRWLIVTNNFVWITYMLWAMHTLNMSMWLTDWLSTIMSELCFFCLNFRYDETIVYTHTHNAYTAWCGCNNDFLIYCFHCQHKEGSFDEPFYQNWRFFSAKLIIIIILTLISSMETVWFQCFIPQIGIRILLQWSCDDSLWWFLFRLLSSKLPFKIDMNLVFHCLFRLLPINEIETVFSFDTNHLPNQHQ